MAAAAAAAEAEMEGVATSTMAAAEEVKVLVVVVAVAAAMAGFALITKKEGAGEVIVAGFPTMILAVALAAMAAAG